MRKWIIKAIIQKVASLLPYGNKVNFFFQKYVSKGLILNKDHFNYKFEHLVDHISFFLAHTQKQDLSGETCLELGTGWYPIVPIGLFLKGAQKIQSVDISPLITVDTFLIAVDEILKREDLFKQQLGSDIAARFEVLKSIAASPASHWTLETLTQQVNLELIVADARTLPLPKESVSLITSNNTFEHVYPHILSDILVSFWGLLKPGGLMSHFIDMSDHFAHMDKTITIYNFLKFSNRAWAIIDNTIQPQSRWRFIQYKSLFDQLGIPYREEKIRPGSPATIKQLNLHAEWQSFSAEELAISHGYLLSIKPT